MSQQVTKDAPHQRTINYQRRTILERIVRFGTRLVIAVGCKLDIEGLEHLPESGPVVITPNHISMLDGLLAIAIVPRRLVLVVSGKYRDNPIVGGYLRNGGVAVFTSVSSDGTRGGRGSYGDAVAALHQGAAVIITPEGHRSQAGLLQGRMGAARMATDAQAPVIVAALWNQEHLWQYWRRFKRLPVHVRIAPLLQPPAPEASEDELAAFTQEIMLTMARRLPPEYRGVYANAVDESNSAIGS